MQNKPRTLFLSHGGGPLPLLGDENHHEMISCLHEIKNMIEKPSTIIVISAHWEADAVQITSGENPGLIYDYYGFPEASYQIQYPCLGNPSLATQIYAVLNAHQIPAELNHDRGFDHGVFVPLKILYPNADIPCVQVSLVNHLDPEQHLKIGTALQSLNIDNLLVIGSGFSFHNMQAFFSPKTDDTKIMNEVFEDWLHDTCHSPNLSEAERKHRLIHWEQAPFARFCHPREEHLLPLHVCYGFANKRCSHYFQPVILNKKASMILWQ